MSKCRRFIEGIEDLHFTENLAEIKNSLLALAGQELQKDSEAIQLEIAKLSSSGEDNEQ